MNWFFCGESEEDLKVMVGRFVEVCRFESQEQDDGVRWEGGIGM